MGCLLWCQIRASEPGSLVVHVQCGSFPQESVLLGSKEHTDENPRELLPSEALHVGNWQEISGFGFPRICQKGRSSVHKQKAEGREFLKVVYYPVIFRRHLECLFNSRPLRSCRLKDWRAPGTFQAYGTTWEESSGVKVTYLGLKKKTFCQTCFSPQCSK